MFLFSTMANAQTASNSISDGNTASKETNVKQMGICLVGEGGPL